MLEIDWKIYVETLAAYLITKYTDLFSRITNEVGP